MLKKGLLFAAGICILGGPILAYTAPDSYVVTTVGNDGKAWVSVYDHSQFKQLMDSNALQHSKMVDVNTVPANGLEMQNGYWYVVKGKQPAIAGSAPFTIE